jgi:hypothetical protein
LDPPADPPGEHPRVPLLREFCSQPLPRFRRVSRADGWLEDQLVPGEVGIKGAVTCITGDAMRSIAPAHRCGHDRHMQSLAVQHTPCETLLFDLFAHESLFGRMEPKFCVYSELDGPANIPDWDEAVDLLLTTETVTYLGKGSVVAHTPHVPRYAEMIRYTFEKLGLDGERFDVYRVEMAYPIIPTVGVMAYPLPEAAAE